MGRFLVLFIIGCLAMMVSMTWAHTCYFCEDRKNPVGGDCWNQTAKVAKIVNCTKPCYTAIFQSGGGHDTKNYWSIKRGCTGLNNEEESCEESSNCESPHFGKCMTCCSEDLCNGVTVGYTLQPATLLCLTLSMLFSLPYSVLFM